MTSASVRVLPLFGASGASLARPGILQTDLTDLEGTREPLRDADQLARRREDTRRTRADVEAGHNGDKPRERHAELAPHVRLSLVYFLPARPAPLPPPHTKFFKMDSCLLGIFVFDKLARTF